MATFNIDLAAILRETQQVIQTNNDLGMQAQQETQRAKDLTREQQAAAKQTADAASSLAESKLRAQQAQEQAALSIANRLGTNAVGNNWLIEGYANTVKETEATIQKKLKDIEAKDSITFLDNPLGYLIAQSTVNQDIAEHNAAVRSRDAAKNAASSLQSISDAAVIGQSRLTQTVTEAGIAQSKILAGYEFNKEANKAALDGIRFNLEGIDRIARIPSENLRLLYSANGAIAQERSFAMEKERLNLARAEAAERNKARQEKLDEDSFIVKNVARGFFNLTGQQMDEAKVKDIKFLMKSDPKFQAYFESGIQTYAADSSGRTSVISTSPFRVLQMSAGGALRNLNSSQQEVVTELSGKYQTFLNSKEGKAASMSEDKSAKGVAFDKYITAEYAAQAKSAQKGSIYSPASFDLVATKRPDLATSKVYTEILKPLQAAGIDTSDVKTTTASVMNGVAEGKITLKDALKLSEFYGAGLMASYETRNMKAYGLPPPTAYTVQINATGLPFGSMTVNMADEKSYLTFLNRQLAMRRASEVMLPSSRQFAGADFGAGLLDRGNAALDANQKAYDDKILRDRAERQKASDSLKSGQSGLYPYTSPTFVRQ